MRDVSALSAPAAVGRQVRIACIHQGYELYGSDRCFAETVATIRSAYPAAEIEVVLPRRGPLVELLRGNASRIQFEPIWVLRRRNLLELLTTGLFALPGALFRAWSRMRNFDLVYINTSVVADYILAARFFKKSTLLHIHEIPEGNALRVLRAMVRWSRAEIVFNSNATQAAFALPKSTECHVIYNGISGPQAPQPSNYDGQRKLRVLMLGRINRIKGQEVLIEAVRGLPDHMKSKLAVRMVGDAFEDRPLEMELRARVQEAALSKIIQIEPFTAETANLYQWADVIVVPSRRPESLGRVAIEAMAFARPPIASAIGGLTEVVDDGVSGWLVPPDRADVLASTLRMIMEDPNEWRDFGSRARARYDLMFSERSVSDAIKAVLHAKLASNIPHDTIVNPPIVSDMI